MTTATDTAAEAFMAAGPDSPIPDAMLTDDQPEVIADDAAEVLDDPSFSLISAEDWQAQWVFLHFGIGSYVSNASGAECDLATLAANPQGEKAATAAYNLCLRNERLKRLFLNEKVGVWADMFAIGMHAWGCKTAIERAFAQGSATA